MTHILLFFSTILILEPIGPGHVMSIIAPGAQKHIAVTTILFSLTIIAVYSRFIARRRARLFIGADDWTLLGALTLVSVIYIGGIVCKFASIANNQ